jgi:PAS domain S-box-containing protein
MQSKFVAGDLMTILQAVEDAVVKIDHQLRYTSMNSAAENYFKRLGQHPEMMLGKTLWEVFPQAKGTVVERELKRAVSDFVPVHYEICFPPNDPDARWYETQAYPSADGLILIFRDITARKAAS